MPDDYLRESLQGRVSAELDWRYGFHWRSGVLALEQRTWSWAAAMGNGGQRLYLVPGLDLVIVILAGRYNQPYPQNARASDVLFGQIVGVVERHSNI